MSSAILTQITVGGDKIMDVYTSFPPLPITTQDPNLILHWVNGSEPQKPLKADGAPAIFFYANPSNNPELSGKTSILVAYLTAEKKIVHSIYNTQIPQTVVTSGAAALPAPTSKIPDTKQPTSSVNSDLPTVGSATQGPEGSSGPVNTSPVTTSSLATTSSLVTAPGQSRVPTNGSSENDEGLPSGAAAGLAIGCLIAGALIASALVWFFFIRSRRGRGTRDMEASSVALIRTEKGPVAKTTSLESGSPPARSLDNGLPQPLEDGAIAGEISKISSLIKNHVQSFYHHDRAGLGMLDLDDLQALGSLPISPGTLSTLLGNVDTREIALRFSIAWTIISRIQPSDNASTTFLPPEIATCFQSIPVATHKTRAQANYLGKWRSVTAELMQSSYGRSTFPVTDPRTRNIEKAANILDGILRPYVDSRVNNNERRRNLEEILKRAAIFAFTLFSQPSSWDFDWRGEEGVQSNSLCIFPALVQVTDELGDPVKPPRALSEAIVRKLDG